MKEKLLNAIYNSREDFDTLQPYLDEADFEGISAILYKYAREYYERDVKATYVDEDVILSKLERNSVKNLQQYKEILYGFVDDLSTINLRDELIKLKREQVSDKLVEKLVSDDDAKSADVRSLIEQYQFYDAGELDDAETTEAKVYNSVDVADIIGSYSEDKLIKLYPPSLNNKVGGILPQSHVVVFARPEVGKSLFTINLAASMAARGKRVLFVEMEDPTDATVLRFISNMTGLAKDDLINNPDNIAKARKLLSQRGYDNVTVAEAANASVASIEKLIIEHKPQVVFVNQLRQLKFKNADGDVQKLAMAGASMRRLAKKHNIVVVSIHQAAETGDGKLTLDLRDMYMSKTALQGDVDLAIGVGINKSFPEDRRMISICKNKNGWHGCVPVRVEETLSRVRDVR